MEDSEAMETESAHDSQDGTSDKSQKANATALKKDVKLAQIFDDDDDDDNGDADGDEHGGKAQGLGNVDHLPEGDEMLDNDDLDDKDMLGAANAEKKPTIHAVLPVPASILAISKYTDPEVMTAFYQRLFPFRYLFQWLNHSVKPSNDFAHREFAFTLQNDAYLRYQSFLTGDLLRKQALQMNPSRFEIGPVYTANPRDRKLLTKSMNFRPIAKELVFDIDLTDYDEIRTCCEKANICLKCWQFIPMAIKVVDTALREDFGFEHILWVYSGRRGAHAWISDRRARQLDDTRRRAIAGYLEVVKGGAQAGKKVNVRRPLHRHLARSLELLKPYFARDILEIQDPFTSAAGADRLLSLLSDPGLVSALRKKWNAAPGRNSVAKWADIDALAKSGASKTLDGRSLLEAKQDIVLEYTYPRLDVEVSKKLNHLLKSPFVVHPGTGRVCVPIDPGRLDDFDPLAVPTVTNLLAEIDAHDKQATNIDQDMEGKDKPDSSKPAPDYEKTSLKPYMELFQRHVSALLKAETQTQDAETKVKKESGGDPMEF